MIMRQVTFLVIFFCAANVVVAQEELDISFNGTGKATVDFVAGSDVANAVIVQPDNKIVAVGTANVNGIPRTFALARFNTDGTLDATFGTGGRVVTDFDSSAPNQGAYAAALQPDGKIIAGGYVSYASPNEGAFAVARYNTDGSLDTTFGTGGKVLTNINRRQTEIHGLAIAPDGKIVAAGFFFTGSMFQTLIVKYNSDGTVAWQKQDIHGGVAGTFNAAHSLAVQPDGTSVTDNCSRSGAIPRF